MMRNKVTTVALRTALLYAGASALWILLSDRLLALLISDPIALSQWSILKGWGFVGVTAALLFFGLRRQLQRWAAEVARREQAQAHLLQSQNRQLFLTFLIEKSEQPLAIGYRDGRLGLVNRAFCDLVGYTAGELQRLDWNNNLTPREWREVENLALAQLAQNGHPIRYEKEYSRKNGSRVPIERLVHSGTDEAGEKCFYAIVTDISARKRAEKRLRLFAELGARLNIARTAREAGEIVVDVADKLFGWDACKFTLCSQTDRMMTQLLTMDTVEGRREEFAPDKLRVPPTPLMQEILDHGAKLVLKEKIGPTPGTTPFGNCARPSASVMYAPIRHGSELSGIASIHSYKFNAYDQADLEVFQSLADYCGGAIERIRAEEEVARNEFLYRTLFELCPDGIALEDTQGNILDANHAFCTQTGYSREELRKLQAKDLAPTDRTADVDANLAMLLAGKTLNHQVLNRTKDGTLRLIELHEKTIVLPEGKPGILVVAKDVTSRRQTDEQLRKLSRAVEQSPASIVITDRCGNIEYVNPKFCQITGYTSNEVRGKNPRVLKSGELPAEKYQELWQTILRGEEWRGEFHNQKKNGEMFWESASISAIVDDAGRITHFLAVKEDITEHKRLEDEIRQREQHFRTLIEATSDIIVLVSPEGNMTFLSPSVQRVLGFTPEEMVNTNAFEYIHPEDFEKVRIALTKVVSEPGTTITVDYRFRRKDGSWCVLSTVGRFNVSDATKGFVVVSSRDITESRKLEEHLRQSQKMDSIGQLAGGVAHDFNNLLAVIQGHTDLLDNFGPINAQQKESTEEIRRATERAVSLTRQLLLFSRRQTLQLRDIDLNEIVTGITKMLRRIVGEDIQIQCRYAPRPLPLRADAGMLDQILLNFAVNSRDAMPGGGQLNIATSEVTFTDATAAQSPGARPGQFVCLSVTDTGCGIAPEILPRIFDPFFTTKEVGKGTGLGLATVFGIAQQHRGWINVESAPGQGTTFHVYFPRLSDDTASAPAEIATAPMRGGSETILLVEDDPAVRTLTQQVLKQLGYRVLTASSGREALEDPGWLAAEPRLLLTDLVMPGGVSGLELARKLTQQNPRLKVIYTSGYSPEIAGKDAALREGVNFLAKPFNPRKLAQAIRDSLDRD